MQDIPASAIIRNKVNTIFKTISCWITLFFYWTIFFFEALGNNLVKSSEIDICSSRHFFISIDDLMPVMDSF